MVNREDYNKPMDKVQVNDKFEEIWGSGGGNTSTGNNFIPSGSIENGYTPAPLEKDTFINKNLSINNDNDSYGNWIKRVSINKSVGDGMTFNNNVFSSSSEKILWGEPQRYSSNEEGGGYQGSIHCSENENNYTNFSLDDEASYYSTQNNKHYSAIGIKDNVVSGDFFAKVENGNIYSGENNYCFGKWPILNTGYVFKSLPDEELFYSTYTGSLEKFKDNNGNILDGVYYSSFIYPVIEKPFKVDTRFFIWDEFKVTQPDDVFGEATLFHEEMAGRTEMRIENGIRFNDNLGSIKKDENSNLIVYGLDVSNIKIGDLIAMTSGRTLATHVKGMDVATTDSLGNEIIVPAYNKDYSVGVSGISEVHYEITEGYPYINDDLDLSYLVTRTSDSVAYDGYFPEYIGYEILPGEGLNIIKKGEGGTGSGKGFKCLQPANATGNNRLLIRPDGNDGYIYSKEGENQPDYWVLCTYDTLTEKETNSSSEGADRLKNGYFIDIDGKRVASKHGDLVIVHFRYYTNKQCNVRYSYERYVSDNDDDGIEKVDVVYDLHKDGGWAKSTVKDIKNNLYELFDKFHGTTKDKKDKKPSKNDLVKPVPNYRINSNVESWFNTIVAHAYNHGENKRTLRDDEKDSILYYVDEYPISVSQNGMGKSSLYKIYPVIIRENIVDDGIDLSMYAIEGRVLNSSGDYIIYNTNTKSASFTIEYEITHTDDSNTDKLSATNLNEALKRLNVAYDDNETSIGNVTSNKWSLNVTTPSSVSSKEIFDSTTSSSVYYISKDNEGKNDSYYIKYYVTLSFKNMTTNGVSDNIMFYITEKGQGENFSMFIEEYIQYMNIYLDSNLTEKLTNSSILMEKNKTQVLYIAYKDTEETNENIFLLDRDSYNNILTFDYNLGNQYTKYIGEDIYRARELSLTVKKGLNPGLHYETFKFGINSKSNDDRYISSITPQITIEEASTLSVKPNVILVYISGKTGSEEATISSNKEELNTLLQTPSSSPLDVKSLTNNWAGFELERDGNILTFNYDGISDTTIGREYDYELSLIYEEEEVKTNMTCIASPYAYVKLYNYNFDKNVYNIFNNDPPKMVDIIIKKESISSSVKVSAGGYTEIIPNDNDINDEVIDLNITYEENPPSGFYYLTRKEPSNNGFNFYTEDTDKNVYFLDNIGVTDFSEGAYPTWDISLPIEYYKPTYSVANGLRLPSLYMRRVEIGDNYILKLINETEYDLRIKTFRGKQTIAKGAEVEINFSGITLNNNTFKMFQIGPILEGTDNASILGANVNTQVGVMDSCVFDNSISYAKSKRIESRPNMNKLLGKDISTLSSIESDIVLGASDCTRELIGCSEDELCPTNDPNCPSHRICVHDTESCPTEVELCDIFNPCDSGGSDTGDTGNTGNTVTCTPSDIYQTLCKCDNVDNDMDSIPDIFECGVDRDGSGIHDEYDAPSSDKDVNENGVYDIYECGIDTNENGLDDSFEDMCPLYNDCPANCVAVCELDCPCNIQDNSCPDTGEEGELITSIDNFYITCKPAYSYDNAYVATRIYNILSPDIEDAASMPFATYLTNLCVKGGWDVSRRTYVGTATINLIKR